MLSELPQLLSLEVIGLFFLAWKQCLYYLVKRCHSEWIKLQPPEDGMDIFHAKFKAHDVFVEEVSDSIAVYAVTIFRVYEFQRFDQAKEVVVCFQA